MNQSLWQTISKDINKTYPQLTEHVETDVVIIGAGITGITAALELLQAGKKVVVLESWQVGGATTSMSTGNLYVPVQPLMQHVIKKFGLNTTKEVVLSRQKAIDYIEHNVTRFNIPCHFTRRPWYACSTDDNNRLSREFEAFKRLEMDVQSIKELPLPLPLKQGIALLNQARFNPLQYVLSLAEIVQKKGGHIYEQSPVTCIRDENKCTVFTTKGSVAAQDIIMATHTPLGINTAQFFTAPYRSYVVGINENKIYPEGNIWTFDKPSFALSTHATQGDAPNVLLVAGSHHKTGQKNASIAQAQIEHFLQSHFKNHTIQYHWSAQHYHAADTLPYIGLANKKTKHCYMATGFFADGLVYGTLAGIRIPQMILQGCDKEFSLYSSLRHKPLASLLFLAKENSNVLVQYASDLPLFTTETFNDLKAGEGKIVERNKEKIAVCRDKDQVLHKVSAVCPHMKCIVRWNNVETSWDCPCHGSRFRPSGEVIEGPAFCGLKKLD